MKGSGKNMTYRALGKTGMRVSEIGFGCMRLGRITHGEAEELLLGAVGAGINYFDTADLYDHGANEELVGRVLRPVRSGVILATKVGNQWREDGSGWDWNPRREYIIGAVEGSLRRLGTDYIDLYQLHGGTIQDPLDETIEAFEMLKQQGKILHYGISSIRPNVIREYVKRSGIGSVMLQYSLLDRRPEETVLDLLHEAGVGVLVRGALAQGLLVDKPARAYLGLAETEVAGIKSVLARRFAAVDKRRVAFQFVLAHPAVSCAVVGIRTMDQLETALAGLEKVDERLLEVISGSLPVNYYQEHR